MDVLRLVAVACYDTGWISAQRGVLCDWPVSIKTGSMSCINAECGHSEHLLWHCLPDIPVATHDNRFLSEPPTTTHNWVYSELPTFERMQWNFSQMKVCNSQVTLVTFSGGVGKWITVYFFWDNISNQKYVWIIVLKITFLDFPRESSYIWQVKWTYIHTNLYSTKTRENESESLA